MKKFMVFTTTPTEAAASLIAKTLVEERLAACVQVLPAVTSFYHWKGKLEECGEYLVLIKTTQELLDELVAKIESLHPYDLPEVVALGIEGGSQNYLKWIEEEAGRQA